MDDKFIEATVHNQVNPKRQENRATTDNLTEQPADDPVEVMRRRVGRLDPIQVKIWRQMTPAQRLDIAFQAYQFALDIVRMTERQKHPNLSPTELAWRVTRRMQGNPKLGRVSHESSQRP